MVGSESDFSGSVAHSNDFAGIDFLNGRKAGGEKLAEVIQTVGGGLEDHDGDRSASFRKFQEFTILFSSPARFLNCYDKRDHGLRGLS